MVGVSPPSTRRVAVVTVITVAAVFAAVAGISPSRPLASASVVARRL